MYGKGCKHRGRRKEIRTEGRDAWRAGERGGRIGERKEALRRKDGKERGTLREKGIRRDGGMTVWMEEWPEFWEGMTVYRAKAIHYKAKVWRRWVRARKSLD